MILVVGATGRLGGIISLRLLAEGRPTRVLVRQDSNYQALVEDGALPVFGDLKDRASLDAACQGIDTLITTANSILRGGADNPETVEKQGNRNLIDAAKAAGVKQFIFVSISGADPASPIPFVAGNGLAERYLRESGIPYTIIAPGPFTEVWIGMVVASPAVQGLPVTTYGPAKQSFISISDVANFTIAAIHHPAAINQRLVLGGPEAVSFEEAAAVFGRMLGREVPVVQASPGEPVPCVPTEVLPMMAVLSTEDWIISTGHLANVFHTELTPFETTARAILLGMRAAVR